MSQRLISRSPDLKALRDEGFDVVVSDGHVVVRSVPYVTKSCIIERGSLVCPLDLAGDTTTKPRDHVVFFVGDDPCDHEGHPLERIINARGKFELTPQLTAQFSFSSKPPQGYDDYHDKLTTYAAMLEQHAQAIDPTATARTFPTVEADEDDPTFRYVDSASSRAGISAINNRLALQRVAIVGLGGTGSYILDLVAKTPIVEIHLFDRDRFYQHNAFRSPGAPSLDELAAQPPKVEYLARQYEPMRRGIVPHVEFISEANVHQLTTMDFVFLSLDGGEAKRLAVDALESAGLPFIDVGVGVDVRTEGALAGQVRTTLSSAEHRGEARHHIPFSDGDANNAYSRNIQIADLNALNAALAVIRWKRFAGFYEDLEPEITSVYAIDGNYLANERADS